jgi:hypothetical protein
VRFEGVRSVSAGGVYDCLPRRGYQSGDWVPAGSKSSDGRAAVEPINLSRVFEVRPQRRSTKGGAHCDSVY